MCKWINTWLKESGPIQFRWSLAWTLEHNTLFHFWGSCFFAGPPGPPEAVTIDEITDTTAQLSWRPGPDNHSPVTMYVIQARTPFSVGWQAVNTGTILDALRWCLSALLKQCDRQSTVAGARGIWVLSQTQLPMHPNGSVSSTSDNCTIVCLIFFFIPVHVCLFVNISLAVISIRW